MLSSARREHSYMATNSHGWSFTVGCVVIRLTAAGPINATWRII